MKYLIATIFCAASMLTATAQTEGKIIFEEKVDLHRRLPEDRPEIREMLPQYRSAFYELFYTEGPSIYRARESEGDEEIVRSQGQTRMHMRMAPPKREVYKDLSSDLMVDEREFMTKMFLIKGKAAPFQWRIGEGQKQILNYVCMQAKYQDSVDRYVVWFTPQIPVSNGPAEFGGLPGMILQVDINQGERVITATEVTALEVDKALLQEPKKGKEVTQEEFQEIVRAKMAEMHEMRGSGGPMIMIRQ